MIKRDSEKQRENGRGEARRRSEKGLDALKEKTESCLENTVGWGEMEQEAMENSSGRSREENAEAPLSSMCQVCDCPATVPHT